MADIQYLNYGNLQIELLALMNSLANNVQNYVNNQSWSKKRKEKFMSAYSDLINRGIVGASNETGLWLITVNGDDIDFSNKDKKDKEMYNEAAYFIQQLMASLPTRTTTTPEEDKSKLQLFDNDYFNKSFTQHLSNGIAGGGDIQIGGENDMWNYLDKRDEKGLRGRTERAKKLAEYLKSYSDSLEEGKYNFEGTAFNNLADFKSKVGKAIEALNTNNLDDDYPALNAIGLKNPQQYFYNGSNDPFKTDGYEGTYGDYYGTYLPGLLKKKAEEEVQKKKQAAQEFENNRLYFKTHKSKFFGKDLNYLAEKYQSELNLVPVLQEYVQKGFGNLTPDEISELVGAFKYGAQDPISDEELKAFRAYSPVFKNATKNQFRKFRGVEGAFFHVPSGKVYTYGGRDSLPTLTQQNTGDILKGRSTADKQQAYLLNTDFTDADWAELTGIGLDIASIIDPEPWSAGTMGVLAAGARNYAKVQQPESWGIGDYIWQGVDYLTGAAGAIPVLGDTALAYKAVKSVVPWLRKAMRVPAFLDLWNSTPGMVDVGKKLFNGEDLTVLDWRNLGTFVRGLATTRNLNVLNRAARKALLKRGIETTNSISLKIGLTRTKPLSETTLPTIKVEVNGNKKDIPIKPETRTKLENELISKGNDLEARSKVIKGNAEVKAAAKKAGVDLELAKIIDEQSFLSSLTNARLWNNKFGIAPKWARINRGLFGETPVLTTRGNDEFETYLSGNRSLWDKYLYGSNRTLRGMDKLNSIKYKIPETQNVEVDKNSTRILEGPTPLLYRQSQVGRVNPAVKNPSELPENVKFNRETINNYKNMINGNFSNNKLQGGSYNLTGTPLLVVKLFDGTFSVLFKGNVIANERNQREIQKTIRNLIKNTVLQGKLNSSSKISAKEMGKLLKEFKAKGWLKHGGTIDKQKIQKYKESINK